MGPRWLMSPNRGGGLQPVHRLIEQTVEATIRERIKSESEARADAVELYHSLQLPMADIIDFVIPIRFQEDNYNG